MTIIKPRELGDMEDIFTQRLEGGGYRTPKNHPPAPTSPKPQPVLKQEKAYKSL